MYCPKCKAEYRPGITVCADCGVPLVYELPQEEPEERPEIGPDAQFVELLATYNLADIAIVKSILDNAGISYYFRGDHTIMTRPYIDPARLMVRKGQVEEVRNLLKDLELKFHISLFSDDQEER